VQSVPIVPGLPLVGNFFQFQRDRLGLQDLAARTGPLARVQIAHIPAYVVSDADLAHLVLNEQAARFKKSAAMQYLRPLLGDGLLLSEGSTHKRHRKLLAPAFAPKRLAAYGATMVEETVRQVDGWRHGARIDIATEMMEMTLAIAGRTMFGADIRGDATAVAEGLELGMRSHQAAIKLPVGPSLGRMLPRARQMRRGVELLDEVVYRLIAEGRARGTDRGDVLSILLLARDDEDGTGLSDQQVRDEAMTLLLAGHETTANALTWTWYELARNPAMLATLCAEIDRLGKREITVDDLPALPYNLAVFEETMRLHPPAYMTGREALEPITLAGHHLPAGSLVLINIRGIQRHEAYWPSAGTFDPTRMLPEAKKARPRHYYLPFGAGPRVCIGSHFALLEGQLALATMVQRARLRLLATRVVPEPMVTLRPRGGMPAVVELR
jgi:cytochrome P450